MQPLAVCLDEAPELSTRDVIYAVQSIVGDEEIKCVTAITRKGTWHITSASETARDVLFGPGLDVNYKHYAYELHRPRQERPPPAFISVLLKDEMSDEVVSNINNYSRATRVLRRCYSFATSALFTVVNPFGTFPTSYQFARYTK